MTPYQFRLGMPGSGEAGLGAARPGKARALPIFHSCGRARPGEAGPGEVGHGEARLGKAWAFSTFNLHWLGDCTAGLGPVRHGVARPGTAGQGKAWIPNNRGVRHGTRVPLGR